MLFLVMQVVIDNYNGEIKRIIGFSDTEKYGSKSKSTKYFSKW